LPNKKIFSKIAYYYKYLKNKRYESFNMIQLLFIALIINNAISAMDMEKSKNTQNTNELLKTFDRIKEGLAKDSYKIPSIPESLFSDLPSNYKNRILRLNSRLMDNNRDTGIGVFVTKKIINQETNQPEIINQPYIDEKFKKNTIAIIDEVRNYLNAQKIPPSKPVEKITCTIQPSAITASFGSGKIHTHFHITTFNRCYLNKP